MLKPYCRAGHDMTPENTRIETVRQRGKEYQVRRCKRCQCIYVGNYLKALRRELKKPESGPTHRAGRISEQ